MVNKTQKQEVEPNGVAVQAGRDINFGLSYAEVKEVALDVFVANFIQLRGVAREAARERAEQITQDFLNKLQRENPTGLEQANTPDFQDALFTVQKQYANTNDKELGQLLVDLLVDRTKQKSRDILQVVLTDSLHIAPKLTSEQLAVLAVVFYFRHAQQNFETYQAFSEQLTKFISPFANNLKGTHASLQRLVSTGCGSVSMGEIRLTEILRNNYGGLFNKGFDPIKIADLQISADLQKNLLVPCLNDPTKLQFKVLNEESLNKLLLHNKINDDQKKILYLFQQKLMNHSEITAKVIENNPFMDTIFKTWQTSQMKNLELTDVGMAIAHANIQRLAGEFAELAIWIN